MNVLRTFAVAAMTACLIAPAGAIESENEVVGCSDVSGIAELAGKVGLTAEVRTSDGNSAVLVMSMNKTPFAVVPVVVPSLGGCMAILFIAPFGADNGDRAALYNKFNASEMGAFGAVATTFEGEIALGHSQLTKYGMIAGNMAAEIAVFAERADAFAQAVKTGMVVSAVQPRAKKDKAYTGAAKASPFADPAFAKAARAAMKDKAFTTGR